MLIPTQARLPAEFVSGVPALSLDLQLPGTPFKTECHSFIHPFIHHILIEPLLRARHWTRLLVRQWWSMSCPQGAQVMSLLSLWPDGAGWGTVDLPVWRCAWWPIVLTQPTGTFCLTCTVIFFSYLLINVYRSEDFKYNRYPAFQFPMKNYQLWQTRLMFAHN